MENLSQVEASAESNYEDQDQEPTPAPLPDSKMNLRVTGALFRKLSMQAQDEGVTLDEYVTELLAEGVVLRAWEIVERKAQMRGGPQPQGNSNRPNNNNNNRNNNNRGGGNNDNKGGQGGGGGGRRGNMPQSRYNNIMEDKAAFLEYVRNQERKRR